MTPPLTQQIMIETEQLPGGGSGVEDMKKAILLKPENLAVRTIVKLLRTIAVDGFRCVCVSIAACTRMYHCMCGFAMRII